MSQAVAWILLIVSGLLDVAWAISVKYADGYTRWGWSLLSLVLLGAFIYLLGRTLEVLPVGTAYAVLDWHRRSWHHNPWDFSVSGIGQRRSPREHRPRSRRHRRTEAVVRLKNS
jgi:hypothetical protein